MCQLSGKCHELIESNVNNISFFQHQWYIDNMELQTEHIELLKLLPLLLYEMFMRICIQRMISELPMSHSASYVT